MSVTLTINNQRVVVAPDGATILEAARDAGIRIPTLCHHPDLSNVGAAGVRRVGRAGVGVQTACTTPVFEGMVVDTESKDAGRRGASYSACCSATTRTSA